MAKKQTFGDKVLAAKLAQRKMAKVIISEKSPKGTKSSPRRFQYTHTYSSFF